jgi:hypothetical protein
VVAEFAGVRQFVQNLGGGLVGIRASDGKLLWQYDKVSSRTANMATPAVRGDTVFAVSGYNTGCALLQLVRRDGSFEVKELYFDRNFQSLYGGMILLGEHAYAGHGGGFSTGLPTCYAWKAGKVVWQQRGPGVGGVATVAADGHLYLRFADGLVVLAEATPEGFKEKGRFNPPDRSKMPAWSVPVVAHGRLFLRDQANLVCYDLRADAPGKAPPPDPKEKQRGARQPDAAFVPSPPEVVEKMLEMARVTADDVVYDLGCGDGRVVVAAARKYRARGVGVELDPTLVARARDEARRQGVEGRVAIREGDLFAADFGDATVVALYLLPRLNARLLPRLKTLRPGTRIVSHAFPIDGVRPERVARFRSADGLTEHAVFLYVTPLRPGRADAIPQDPA